jgi:hypothetical protein
MFIQNTFQSTLPVQQISLKEKLKDMDEYGVSKFMKASMDALEAIGRMQWVSNYDLKENYDLIRGRFIFQHYLDRNDMFDLSSAVSQEFNMPSYIKHYDITSKAVNVLVGEYLKRPDGFRVRANDKESSNEIKRMKTEMLHSYVQSKIAEEINNKLIQQGLDPYRNEFKNEEEQAEYQELIQQQTQALTPPQLEDYLRNDYFTAAEQFGQHIIELDKDRFNLKEVEAKEFEDMLVADRCFRHFFLTATGYAQETWNPLNTFFHRSPEVEYTDDGDYVGRVFWLSKAQIIDRYGWMMTQKQIEALYPKEEYKGTGDSGILNEAYSASIYPFGDYRDYMMQVNALGYDPHTGFPGGGMNQMNQMTTQDIDVLFGSGFGLNFRATDIIMVTEAYWKSQRKIGKLNFIDPETGELTSQIIDETFNPKLFGIKEVKTTFEESVEPNTVAWTWVTQVWKGVKINVNYADSSAQNNDVNKFSQRALYVGVEPAPFQFKGQYNPFIACKLPVVGRVFNNRNGDSMSLVDLLKPYQVLYNVSLNQVYELSQREVGKFVLMDMNLIPNLKDWGGGENFEKFLAVAKAIGIAPVDTKASGAGMTSFASSNSYQVLDASETDRIAGKLNLAILIEDQAYKQIGITPQRLGTIAASETATGINQSVSNSYAQTESYFEKFSNYKRRCLQANIEIAQFVYSKEKDITLNYTMSDLSRGFVNITDPDLLLRDLGVYPTFSQEITRQLETIRQLAINNNTTNMPMSALTDMLTMNSVREIQQALRKSEDNFNKQQQAAQEAEMQQAQAALEAEAAEKQADRDLKKYEIDTKANTELQKVTLQGISNESSFNPELDLTDKLIAQKDIALKEQQLSSQNYTSQQQLVNQQIDSIRKNKLEKEKMLSDKQMKEKEALNKEKIEQAKLTQIEVQNKSQEKINKESNDAKLKLADKQLEVKELEKKMKEMEIANNKAKTSLELKTLKEKVGIEKDLAEIKIDTIKETTQAKVEQIKELSQVKTEEAKETSKISVDLKKKESKIKLDTTKKLAAKRIKDSGKPKK